ncbi:MAG: glyceraldehyde 3-phosphate dehydrogenase NAD-binding domain-containing protein [Paracoccaceae bacterium]
MTAALAVLNPDLAAAPSALAALPALLAHPLSHCAVLCGVLAPPSAPPWNGVALPWNDIVPADNLAYLLKYDSTQGRFNGTVSSKKSSPDKAEDDVLVVNGKEILVVCAKSPAELPWG